MRNIPEDSPGKEAIGGRTIDRTGMILVPQETAGDLGPEQIILRYPRLAIMWLLACGLKVFITNKK
jgi:hypothetical protein